MAKAKKPQNKKKPDVRFMYHDLKKGGSPQKKIVLKQGGSPAKKKKKK